MNVTTTAPTRPAPAEAADLALLTGPDADELVAGALVGAAAAPAGLHVEVAAIHHRPGSGVSVCYDVTYAGLAEPDHLVVSTAAASAREVADRVAVIHDGPRRLRAWRRPDDPALPGLRSALTPAVVAAWLGRDDRPELSVLAYRPTRRAVVAARCASTTAYVKIVRPHRGVHLLQRHLLLADTAAPAPAVLGSPEPGVVLLAEAPGDSLAQVLANADLARVPTPQAVIGALDDLPDAVSDLDRRPSWADRLDFHAAAARAALPDRADEVSDVVRRVGATLASAPVAPVVPTHGDLNVANLFVADRQPSALIDVDSIGPGRRVDDLATLLAHLAVLPSLAPEQYGVVPAVLRSWTPVFADAVGARSLHARTAAVLVSLIAGATPAQAFVRLELARDAVARAEGSPA